MPQAETKYFEFRYSKVPTRSILPNSATRLTDGSMTPIPPPTHYEILCLPSPLHDEPTLTAQTLRAAYRTALLRWHPDKSNTLNVSTSKTITPELWRKKSRLGKLDVYSVDQISTAYSVLSNPKERREYDKELKAQRLLHGGITGNGGGDEDKKFKTGVELVDLDDLDYDEAECLWYRGCRCGDERGFLVREEDLEDAGDEGEVVVGCRGCSLWLRVLFGVVEDEDDGVGIQDAEGLNGKVGHAGT
jgi:diphthamide biosynthesis protein 4